MLIPHDDSVNYWSNVLRSGNLHAYSDEFGNSGDFRYVPLPYANEGEDFKQLLEIRRQNSFDYSKPFNEKGELNPVIREDLLLSFPETAVTNYINQRGHEYPETIWLPSSSHGREAEIKKQFGTEANYKNWQKARWQNRGEKGIPGTGFVESNKDVVLINQWIQEQRNGIATKASANTEYAEALNFTGFIARAEEYSRGELLLNSWQTRDFVGQIYFDDGASTAQDIPFKNLQYGALGMFGRNRYMEEFQTDVRPSRSEIDEKAVRQTVDELLKYTVSFTDPSAMEALFGITEEEMIATTILYDKNKTSVLEIEEYQDRIEAFKETLINRVVENSLPTTDSILDTLKTEWEKLVETNVGTPLTLSEVNSPWWDGNPYYKPEQIIGENSFIDQPEGYMGSLNVRMQREVEDRVARGIGYPMGAAKEIWAGLQSGFFTTLGGATQLLTKTGSAIAAAMAKAGQFDPSQEELKQLDTFVEEIVKLRQRSETPLDIINNSITEEELLVLQAEAYRNALIKGEKDRAYGRFASVMNAVGGLGLPTDRESYLNDETKEGIIAQLDEFLMERTQKVAGLSQIYRDATTPVNIYEKLMIDAMNEYSNTNFTSMKQVNGLINDVLKNPDKYNYGAQMNILGTYNLANRTYSELLVEQDRNTAEAARHMQAIKNRQTGNVDETGNTIFRYFDPSQTQSVGLVEGDPDVIKNLQEYGNIHNQEFQTAYREVYIGATGAEPESIPSLQQFIDPLNNRDVDWGEIDPFSGVALAQMLMQTSAGKTNETIPQLRSLSTFIDRGLQDLQDPEVLANPQKLAMAIRAANYSNTLVGSIRGNRNANMIKSMRKMFGWEDDRKWGMLKMFNALSRTKFGPSFLSQLSLAELESQNPEERLQAMDSIRTNLTDINKTFVNILGSVLSGENVGSLPTTDNMTSLINPMRSRLPVNVVDIKSFSDNYGFEGWKTNLRTLGILDLPEDYEDNYDEILLQRFNEINDGKVYLTKEQQEWYRENDPEAGIIHALSEATQNQEIRRLFNTYAAALSYEGVTVTPREMIDMLDAYASYSGIEYVGQGITTGEAFTNAEWVVGDLNVIVDKYKPIGRSVLSPEFESMSTKDQALELFSNYRGGLTDTFNWKNVESLLSWIDTEETRNILDVNFDINNSWWKRIASSNQITEETLGNSISSVITEVIRDYSGIKMTEYLEGVEDVHRVVEYSPTLLDIHLEIIRRLVDKNGPFKYNIEGLSGVTLASEAFAQEEGFNYYKYPDSSLEYSVFETGKVSGESLSYSQVPLTLRNTQTSINLPWKLDSSLWNPTKEITEMRSYSRGYGNLYE